MNQALKVGEVLDEKFRIISLLGEGGMGLVYLAEDLTLLRQVAIKVISKSTIDTDTKERFVREGKALSQLQHPSVVSLYQYAALPGGQSYLVMEYVEGDSLRKVLADERQLPWQRALSIVIKVCEAMASAHDIGVVHRDLKPENIILGGEKKDKVTIIDFGMSFFEKDRESGQKLTATGALIGTATYMSPEQCRGTPTDSRSDIYSLACVLYECLTGFPPFQAENPIGVIYKHTREQVPGLQQLDQNTCPKKQVKSLELILFKALAKEPGRRYQNMRSFAEHLRLVASNPDDEVLNELNTSLETNSVRKPGYLMLVPIVLVAIFVLFAARFAASFLLNSPPARIASPLSTESKDLDRLSWSQLESRLSTMPMSKAIDKVRNWLRASEQKRRATELCSAYQFLAGALEKSSQPKLAVEYLNEGIKVVGDRNEPLAAANLLGMRVQRLGLEYEIYNKPLNLDEEAAFVESAAESADIGWTDRIGALNCAATLWYKLDDNQKLINNIRKRKKLLSEVREDNEAFAYLPDLLLVEAETCLKLGEREAAARAVKEYLETCNQLEKSNAPANLKARIFSGLSGAALGKNFFELAVTSSNFGLKIGSELSAYFATKLHYNHATAVQMVLFSKLHRRKASSGSLPDKDRSILNDCMEELKLACHCASLARKQDKQVDTRKLIDLFHKQSLEELAAFHLAAGEAALAEIELAKVLQLTENPSRESVDANILLGNDLQGIACKWKSAGLDAQADIIYAKAVDVAGKLPPLGKTDLTDKLRVLK